MAAIKLRNEDFDVVSSNTDGSMRNSKQSAMSSKHKTNGSVALDFTANDSLKERGRNASFGTVTKVKKISP